jgi:hypothetical protein
MFAHFNHTILMDADRFAGVKTVLKFLSFSGLLLVWFAAGWVVI